MVMRPPPGRAGGSARQRRSSRRSVPIRVMRPCTVAGGAERGRYVGRSHGRRARCRGSTRLVGAEAVVLGKLPDRSVVGANSTRIVIAHAVRHRVPVDAHPALRLPLQPLHGIRNPAEAAREVFLVRNAFGGFRSTQPRCLAGLRDLDPARTLAAAGYGRVFIPCVGTISVEVDGSGRPPAMRPGHQPIVSGATAAHNPCVDPV